MTVVSNNPPTPESAGQFMNSFGLMDSRSSLKEPYSSRDGYPGYALAITMMRVPVSTFQAENGSVLPLDKNTLAKAIKVVRGLYVAQKATPGTLSYMGQGAEIFGAVMQQAVEADKFVVYLISLSLRHAYLFGLADFLQINLTISQVMVLEKSTSKALIMTALVKLFYR